MEGRDYFSFGATVARIIADVFYINPTDEAVWSEAASLIIESESSSLKVPSSFYGALTVEASNPQLPWAATAAAVGKVGSQILGTVVSHQAPLIRDAKVKTQLSHRDNFMQTKSFEADDMKKPIEDVVMQMSPKYYRKEQFRQAKIEE